VTRAAPAERDSPEIVPSRGLPDRPGPIEPVAYADLPELLRLVLRPRVRRLRYLGAFFAFAGRQPRALYAFNMMTEELKTALPGDLVEVVALSVATTLGSDYERPQHERLAARQGRSAAWISAAKHGRPADALTPEQTAVRTLALRMVERRGKEVDREMRRVVDLVGQDIAVGVLLLVGRYVAHAHVSNALALTSPVSDAPS
jgi:alkylhydroperoxidase family enzyme